MQLPGNFPLTRDSIISLNLGWPYAAAFSLSQASNESQRLFSRHTLFIERLIHTLFQTRNNEFIKTIVNYYGRDK